MKEYLKILHKEEQNITKDVEWGLHVSSPKTMHF